MKPKAHYVRVDIYLNVESEERAEEIVSEFLGKSDYFYDIVETGVNKTEENS